MNMKSPELIRNTKFECLFEYSHGMKSKSAWLKIGRTPNREPEFIQVRKTAIHQRGSCLPFVAAVDDHNDIVAEDSYFVFPFDHTEDYKTTSKAKPTVKAPEKTQTNPRKTSSFSSSSNTTKKTSPSPLCSLRCAEPSAKRCKPLEPKVQTTSQKANNPHLRNYLPNGFSSVDIPATLRPQVDRFLHILYMRRIVDKKLRTDYVNLKAIYLRNELGGNIADRVRQYLLHHNIVECDGKYQQGRKSYGYRLADPWRDQAHELTAIDAPSMVRRIEKRRSFIKTPTVRWLEKNLSRITIQPNDEKLRTLGGDNRELIATYSDQLRAVVEMPIVYEVDDFGRRVHTPMSNLKKELRSLLRLDDEPLAEIDISNSQPLFLAILLKERGIMAPEFERICVQGLLYNTLADLQDLPRQVAKDEFMMGFFAKNRYSNRTWKLFRERFPEVHRWVREVKAKDYKALCRLLQRRESKFIIHTCCDRLRRMDKTLPVLTIHDSILCRERNAELVKQVMDEEFKSLAVAPMLTIERLCP